MNIPTDCESLRIEAFLELCATVQDSVRPGPFPLADVRSPGEYAKGHIPGAVNIPLFSDAERAEVGLLYKEKGREEAVLHGLECVGPRLGDLVKAAFSLCRGRTAGELALYCSRGGMRSASLGWLFSTVGLRAYTLDGGYKAFRRYALAFFSKPMRNLLVLGGGTGAGKTQVLHRMAEKGAQVADLEGMALHRGSVFGAFPGITQPSSEQFENLLATELLRMNPDKPVWVEDESENLGTVNLPTPFLRQLRASPLFILESSRASRLERVIGEYGILPTEHLAARLDHIRKRLGGLRHKNAHDALAAGELPALADILLEYYDNAYAKQMRDRIPAAVVRTDDAEEAVESLLELGF